MDDCAFDQMLRRLMKLDFSAGTETFRNALLKRCLASLNADCAGARAEGADPESPALEPRDAIGHNGSEDLLT